MMRNAMFISTLILGLVSCASTGAQVPTEGYFFEGRVRQFVEAVERNDWMSATRYLDEGGEVDARGVLNATPLWYVAAKQNLSAFRWLLGRGANPNRNPDEGLEILTFCAWADDRSFLDLATNHSMDLRPLREGFGDPVVDLILSGLPDDKLRRYLNYGVDVFSSGGARPNILVEAISARKYSSAITLIEYDQRLMQDESTISKVISRLQSVKVSRQSDLYAERARFLDYLRERFGVAVQVN